MSIKLETKSENYYLEKYTKYKNKYINLKKKIMKGGNDCIMLNTSYELNDPYYIKCTKEGKRNMHVFRKNDWDTLYNNYLYFSTLNEIPKEDYAVINNIVLDGKEHIANPEVIFNYKFEDIIQGQFITEEWEISNITKKFNEGKPEIIMYNKEKNYIEDKDYPMECYQYIGYQSVNYLKNVYDNKEYYVCDEAYNLLTEECIDIAEYDDLIIEDYEQNTVNKLICLGHQHLQFINKTYENILFYSGIYGEGIFTGKKDRRSGNISKDTYESLHNHINTFLEHCKLLKNPITNGYFYLYRGINSIIFMKYNIGDSFDELLPFSTTYNINFTIKWIINMCCIFRIKIPFNYDMIIGSFPPGYEEHSKQYSRTNQKQYEVTVAPSKLTITGKHKITLNGITRIVYDVDIKRLNVNVDELHN